MGARTLQVSRKRLLDGLIDLPFALPTAVAGITLTTLYAENGWIGKIFSLFHIKVAFTPIGIIVALTLSVYHLSFEWCNQCCKILIKVEEAASSLGASRLQIFVKIILPEIFPALLAGFSLAFARALGEYGSVVFIAGNMPMKTEITPLMIMTKLEQYDYAGQQL